MCATTTDAAAEAIGVLGLPIGGPIMVSGEALFLAGW
jgi:hypothetical protein